MNVSRKLPATLLLSLLLGACAANPAPTGPVVAADAQMQALADEYVDAELQRDPGVAYFVGLEAPRHDRLPDNSPAALAAWQAREDGFLARLADIDPGRIGQPALRVAHAQLREQLESNRQLRICHRELWSISHMDGWHLVLAELAERQPLDTPDLREQALRRYADLARFVDQEIANLRSGLDAGYSVPRSVVARVLAQMDGYLPAQVEDSPLYDPARRSSESPFRVAYASLLATQVQPALQRYRNFLRDEYLPRARTSLGVSALPDGVACYRALARAATTLDRAPQTVVAIGEKAVAENLDTVRALGRQLYGTGDVGTIIARTGQAEDNHFASQQALIDFSAATVEAARLKSIPLFGQLPDQSVVVEPPPAHERGSGLSSHYDPEPDRTRPAVYRINIDNWQADTRGAAEITAVHETWPGHHLQMALAAGLGNQHRLSRLVYNAAYVEGWARYAESLAEEAGIYTTQHALISRRIWPARGMVVDPGIHVGGWSRERARDYLVATGRFDAAKADAQVDRIAAIPAQLTAYDSGGLEILALRREAQAALGADFDLRDFHREVLADGIVPLSTLRARIEAWITSRKSAAPQGAARGS
jgi:uncharacterized protein (DUF885 family)